MSEVWLKFILTTVVILIITWAGRRFGPTVAGALMGLPLTSGPVSLFLSLEQGPSFATDAAPGALTGFIASTAFCAAYAYAARKAPWPRALAVALIVFAIITGVVSTLPMTFVASLVASFVAAIGLWVFTARREPAAPVVRAHAKAEEPWELPVRVLAISLIVVAITLAARSLGPAWSGVLSTLPVFAGVLAPLTQLREGRDASILLLSAMVRTTLSSVAFFGVIGALLEGSSIGVAYALAALSAIVTSVLLARSPRRSEPVAEIAPVLRTTAEHRAA